MAGLSSGRRSNACGSNTATPSVGESQNGIGRVACHVKSAKTGRWKQMDIRSQLPVREMWHLQHSNEVHQAVLLPLKYTRMKGLSCRIARRFGDDAKPVQRVRHEVNSTQTNIRRQDFPVCEAYVTLAFACSWCVLVFDLWVWPADPGDGQGSAYPLAMKSFDTATRGVRSHEGAQTPPAHLPATDFVWILSRAR